MRRICLGCRHILLCDEKRRHRAGLYCYVLKKRVQNEGKHEKCGEYD